MGLLEEARKKREAAAVAATISASKPVPKSVPKLAPKPLLLPSKTKAPAPKIKASAPKPIKQEKPVKTEQTKLEMPKSAMVDDIADDMIPAPPLLSHPEPQLQQSDLDELEKELETQEIPLPEPPEPIDDLKPKKHFDLFSFLKKKDKAAPEKAMAFQNAKSAEEYSFAPPSDFSPSVKEFVPSEMPEEPSDSEIDLPSLESGKAESSFVPKLPEPPISGFGNDNVDDLFSSLDEQKKEKPKKEGFFKWVFSPKNKAASVLDELYQGNSQEDEFAMPEPPILESDEFNMPEAPVLEKEQPSKQIADQIPEMQQPEKTETKQISGDKFIDSLLKSSASSSLSAQTQAKVLPPVPSQKAAQAVSQQFSQFSNSMLPETLSDFEKPREIMEEVESQQERKPSKSVQKLMDKRKQLQDEIIFSKKQIEAMHNEMDALSSEMEEKRKMMEESSRQLDEKEAAVQEKIKSAEDKIKQLESLKGHIEGVRDDVRQKSEHIEKTKVLATQVYADRQAVEQRHSRVSEREKAVFAKESQLKQLESQLKEKEASLQQKEQELSDKESRIKELEDSINSRESELKSREDKVTASESQLEARENQVAASESMLKSRENKIVASESQLKEKEQKLTTEYKGLEDDEFKKYMEEILKEISGQSIKVSQAGDAFSDIASPELVDYITKHLAKGFRQERIMNALKGAGWSDDEIKISMNEALFSSGMVSSRKQLPPVVSASSPSSPARLKGIGQLMSDARNFLSQKKIPQAQQALLDAKRLYDTLRLDENKKQMLKFELQDLKTDIDLALLS